MAFVSFHYDCSTSSGQDNNQIFLVWVWFESKTLIQRQVILPSELTRNHIIKKYI